MEEITIELVNEWEINLSKQATVTNTQWALLDMTMLLRIHRTRSSTLN